MNKKSLVGILLASVMSIGIMSGCGAAKNDTAKSDDANKKYVIACDSKYAPFSFEESGKYKGIDVELLAAIAKEEKFEYDLKPMDFDGIIPGITAGQLDGAIAGMSITDERKKVLDFSDGYFVSGLSLVVNKDDTAIKGASDLNGKKASIKKGTAGAKYAEDNEKKAGITLNYFDDSPSMFQAVENKNCDFLLEDYPVIAYKIKVDPNSKLKIAGDKLTNVDYGFAVKKGGNADLLKKFNEGLKKLKENGEYDKIVGQYIGK
ncbi:polar amino acid transport system substrate-binding protein [Clostridium saccharoperbutylacetonicum]|uniref:Amino acid ABC transporter substrate-binding protein, PAAT family n=1 Tax=Clostridium saccharoperbutylacetonicum N1-4(HMT) TaxID=931276 RepID=M1N3A8_9CLOT|nr:MULTISPECIES: transporter substrate-binding domain-containing protein [Clostridium]AGF57942.1 amino acid ABC transporter substrate-binding protein, PAAT family [Clostridium saccharoperbutylacetonicum N1-4(HMT)]NRT61285.1 polar amino acid transport system substrate-binding protein [Clostridium saccharoperbutylacetonicum]NSB24602.1 polar amino acid transport system substrate-binding protein [Clostridium saccharoperbutylacetonicum]NSB43977.1 polar amino acid transport system substrate-binding p